MDLMELTLARKAKKTTIEPQVKKGDPSPVPRPHGELQIDDNHGAGVDNGAHEPHAPLLSTAVVVDVGQEGNPEDDHGMPESTAEPVGSPLEEVLPVRLAGDLVQVGIVDNRSWVHACSRVAFARVGKEVQQTLWVAIKAAE